MAHKELERAIDDFKLGRVFICGAHRVKCIQIEEYFVALCKVFVFRTVREEVLIMRLSCAGVRNGLHYVFRWETALIDLARRLFLRLRKSLIANILKVVHFQMVHFLHPDVIDDGKFVRTFHHRALGEGHVGQDTPLALKAHCCTTDSSLGKHVLTRELDVLEVSHVRDIEVARRA